MPFGDLLTRVARGEKLSPLELEEFKQEAQTLEDVKNFLKKMNVAGATFIENLRLGASGLNPDGTLLHPFTAAKDYHATDVNITNDTFTTVTFNHNIYNNNAAFRLDDANQKVFIVTKAKAFSANIAHGWEANATGARRVDFQYFDVSGNLIGTALLGVEKGFVDAENWFTNTRLADLPNATEYIKCRVKQNSGGDLHLVYVSIDLSIV